MKKILKKLAALGYKLYAEIITNQEKAFQKKLSDALKNAGAIIQVSSTKYARYVFPWALVYDKHLESGGNTVCPQFISDIKNATIADFLSSQTCIKKWLPA